jgi:hypothetical protein
LGVDADQAWRERKRSDIPKAETREGGGSPSMGTAG